MTDRTIASRTKRQRRVVVLNPFNLSTAEQVHADAVTLAAALMPAKPAAFVIDYWPPLDPTFQDSQRFRHPILQCQ